MKNKCRTKKTFSILSLFLLISFFVFTTCSNISSGSSAYNSKTLKNKKTFTGTISLMGAVPVSPDDVVSYDSSETPRSALPDIEGDFTYFARAESSGKPTISIDGDQISIVNGKVTFSMDLEKDIKWKITAGIKKEGNEILIDVFEARLSDDNPILSHDFILKANPYIAGEGTIELQMTIPPSIKFIKAECSLFGWAPDITVDSTSAKIYCASVPAGSNYDVTINFYDEVDGVVMYSTTQPVSVIAGFSTKKWGEDSSDGVITNGQFVLTDDIVSDFERPQIYVSESGSDSCANGSRYSPYKTLKNAVKIIGQKGRNIDYTILIDGEVQGTTEITSELLPSGKAASLTICGLNSNSSDKLNAAHNGRVLKVATEVPITIKNLTITGGKVNTGNDDAKSGAGIYIASGTVKLADGAKITGNNAASYGGGVYIASGAKLFMYGSSLIGDTIESTATSSTLTSSGTTGCANTAKGGGGIYSMGAVYIGYDGFNGDTPHKSDMTAGYGICRNYASGTDASAGGIICRAGTLMIASGSISYNQSVNHGGGIYGLGNVTIEEPVTATNKFVMYGNTASIGGAIYIGSDCTLTMQAGQIGGSTSGLQNTATTSGGAIFQGEKFKISGSALIYPGAVTSEVKTNDVFLPKENDSNKKFFVTVNTGYSTTSKMSITPEEQKRGVQIVYGDGVTVDETLWNKFALTQDDASWDKEAKTVDSKNYVVINSPIYVAASDSTRKVCTSAPPATGADGLKTKPFATISDAITSGLMDNAETSYTITVDGTINGNQEIPSTLSNQSAGTYKAKELTIKGAKYTENGTTKYSGVLKGSNGSTLTVNAGTATFPVTITNLKITGGKATNGGGINITKGTVVLTDGAVITGNEATYGGGVYVAGGNAVLLMNGKALIGDDATTATTAESTNATTYANKATDGAGIYIGNYAAVYLGYSLDSNGTPTTTNSALISNATNGYYGVRRNYATDNGGGIYSASNNLKIASGNVSYNQAATGGGIYFSAATTVDAGSIDGNKAQNGGGIYIASNTGITFKSVSMTANAAVGTSSAAANGGAVYNNGTLTLSDVTNPASMTDNYASSSSQNAYGGAIYNVNGGSVNINGAATLDNNSATTTGSGKKGYGGAIYNEGVVEMVNGKIGSENANRATSAGGAVYQNGTFKIKGDTNIKNGSATSNDVYVVTSNDKKVIMTGSLSANGNSSSNKMTITPDLIKRGKTVISSYNYTLSDTTDFPKFAVSFSTGWSMILHSSEGKLDADLYVSGTSSNDTNGDGTSSKPYGTLAKAIEQCWDTNKPYTIYVKGTLSGNHEISGTINAKSITLQGTGNSPCINAGASGRPLTINTSKEVTVTGLEITNGKLSSGDGGGINVSGGCTLTLDDGAKITSNDNYTNNTSGKGGGLYIASDSTVIMKDGSLVNLNRAKQGGGVYNEGKLLMYGTARIGSTVTNYPKNPWAATPQTPTGNCSKDAGGGVYNRGTLCLGYSAWTGPTNNQTSNLSNGITGNFAGGQGGGVYTNNNDGANLYFNTGNISYNRSSDRGAGVYIYGTMTMTGGTMTSNCDDSNNGGAMHVNGNLYMSGNVNIPYGLVNDGTWYTNGAQNTVGVETNFDKVITLTENVTYSGTIKVKTTSVDSDVKVIQRDTSFTNVNNFKTSIGKFEFINNNLYKLAYKQVSGTDYAVLTGITLSSITSVNDIKQYNEDFAHSGYIMDGSEPLTNLLGKILYFKLYSDANNDDEEETKDYGALRFYDLNTSAKTLKYEFKRFNGKTGTQTVNITNGSIDFDDYDDFSSLGLFIGLNDSYTDDGATYINMFCYDEATADLTITYSNSNYYLHIGLDGGNDQNYYQSSGYYWEK